MIWFGAICVCVYDKMEIFENMEIVKMREKWEEAWQANVNLYEFE